MDNERNNYAFWILCNRAPLRCGLCKSFDTVSFSLNLYFQDEPIYSIIKYNIRQGGDTMLSARIKAIFVLLSPLLRLWL